MLYLNICLYLFLFLSLQDNCETLASITAVNCDFWHEASNTPGAVSNETGLVSANISQEMGHSWFGSAATTKHLSHPVTYYTKSCPVLINFFILGRVIWMASRTLRKQSHVFMSACIQQQPVSVRKFSVHCQTQDNHRMNRRI